MSLNFLQLLENLTLIFSSGINNWASLHPLITHFPIVLLCLVPFFLGAAIFIKSYREVLLVIAFVLMLTGTLTIFLALSTGNAAAEHLTLDLSAVETLTAHVQLAEKSRLYFSILSGVFLLFLIPARKWRLNLQSPTQTKLLIGFMIAFTLALVILYNAAHYGGKLVHDHKITSTFFQP